MHFYLGPLPSGSLFQSAIIFCFILLNTGAAHRALSCTCHWSLRTRLWGCGHLHRTDGETEAREIKGLLVSSFSFLLLPILGFENWHRFRDRGWRRGDECPSRSPDASILSFSPPVIIFQLDLPIIHSFIHSRRGRQVPLCPVKMWWENFGVVVLFCHLSLESICLSY